jgi:hypothetical protein
MKSTSTTTEIIGTLRRTWDKKLTPFRESKATATARCMKAQGDLANGVITEAECQHYLSMRGEPAIHAAEAALREASVRVYANDIEPTHNAWRREQSERLFALLTEAVEINEGLIDVDTACRQSGMPVGPSCAITDLTDYWLRGHQARVASVLQGPAKPRPTRKLNPNYEPTLSSVAS